MQSSEIVIGNRYGMRLNAAAGEPLIEVKVVEKVGRKGHIKVQHPHAFDCFISMAAYLKQPFLHPFNPPRWLLMRRPSAAMPHVHFAAFERPKLFVDEVRAFFRLVR